MKSWDNSHVCEHQIPSRFSSFHVAWVYSYGIDKIRDLFWMNSSKIVCWTDLLFDLAGVIGLWTLNLDYGLRFGLMHCQSSKLSQVSI